MVADTLRPLSAVVVLAALIHSPAIADVRPPAGQQCPAGAYVTGFDHEGNIICSEPAGNTAAKPVGTVGAAPAGSSPGVTEASTPSRDVTEAAAPAAAAAAVSTSSPAARPDVVPVITDVDPWSVVYGQRELEVVITGSGFTAGSTVVFNGERHDATVDTAGTELRATLNTRGLAIGQYPIKVVNGPGSEALLKRGVVVY